MSPLCDLIKASDSEVETIGNATYPLGLSGNRR
jgi:hypothetical protein